MAKLLRELYEPKPKDEKVIVSKHQTDVIKKSDPTKDDKVFKATNVKVVDRKATRLGNDDASAQKAYDNGRASGVNQQKPTKGALPPTVSYEELEEGESMIHGHQLHPDDQKRVKNSYVHRWTGEHRPSWAKEASTPGPHFKDDNEWLHHTRFKVKKDGRLHNGARHCESSPTWPNHPYLRKESIDESTLTIDECIERAEFYMGMIDKLSAAEGEK